MSLNNFSSIIKLSHKKYRALLKKFRRKRIRQEQAKKRDEKDITKDDEVSNSNPVIIGPENERLKCFVDENEREIQHNLWLEREKKAEEQFLKERERKEKIKNELAQQEKKIREEWEKQQEKEKEEKEKKTSEEQSKKEAVKKREAALLKEISTQPAKPPSDGPTRNPEPPDNFGTELDRNNCPFFIKTGACRFGDRCSRVHNRPYKSNTILIPNMYSHFSIDESFKDEYDTDIGLEYEESETYNHFREFYEDVTAEFKKIGRVVQFKTCCNHEPHLRGNVYVQYELEDDAQTAFQKFNGRWYAGKQLSCEFTTVAKWKTAICGLFASKRCPKGRSCNFLHVFKNPRNEFHAADFDHKRKNQNSRSTRSNSHFYQNKSSRSSNPRSRSRSKSIERLKHRRHRSKRSRSRSPSRDKYLLDVDIKAKRKRSHSNSSSKKKSKKHKKRKKARHHHSDISDSSRED